MFVYNGKETLYLSVFIFVSFAKFLAPFAVKSTVKIGRKVMQQDEGAKKGV